MAKLVIKSKGKVVFETENPEHIANAKKNLEYIANRKREIKESIIKKFKERPTDKSLKSVQ